jgi:hypothetical protein
MDVVEIKDQNEAEAVPVQRENIHNYSDEEKRVAVQEAEQDDYDPTAAAEKAKTNEVAPPEKTLQDYEFDALILLGVSEGLVKQFVHKELSFEEELTAKTAKALAPVIQKYGGELPPWLAPYIIELKAGWYLSSLCVGVFLQLKAIKKVEVEQARQAKLAEEEKQRAAYQS